MAKKKIPSNAASLFDKEGPLTANEGHLLGISDKGSSIKEQPYVVLKYFDPNYQCFSGWNSHELRAFSAFMEKLKHMTWGQVYRTGGKLGNKTGVGYTPHGNHTKLPEAKKLLERISPDINFFELRVTGKARVHGFQVKSAFFLVWLDRNHEICPM